MEITTSVVLKDKISTDKVCSHGQMVRSTMASTSMARRVDTEFSLGLMEKVMTEVG